MTLPEKILSEIGPLVRPFAPAELSLIQSESGKLLLSIRIEHAASFSIAAANGKGPPPAGVQLEKSWDDVNRVTHAQLNAAQRDAPALLDAWAAAACGDYQCELSASHCLRLKVKVGVGEVCKKCEGAADVLCPTCRGAKKTSCPDCGGSGQKTCSHCGGNGKVNCFSCSGRGYTEQQPQYMNRSDLQKIPNQVNQSFARVPCDHCGASGKVVCSACSGGKVTCTRCGMSGKIDCATCKASGRIPCDACDATGATHRTAWIECATAREISVGVSGDSDEDQDTFLQRVPVAEYARLASATGGVSLEKWSHPEAHRIACDYLADIPLVTANVAVGADKLTIRAYGPDSTIYHYHGLVGKLLENDLAVLEQCVKQAGFASFGNDSPLALAATQFLDSELNVQIVEGTSGEKKTAAGRANEMVSEQYLSRAVPAVTQALAKLHGGFLRIAVIAVALISTLLFSISRHGLLITGPISQRLGILVLITIASWWSVEVISRRRMKKLLGGANDRRLNGGFQKQRRRYRLWCAAGFLLAWYLSMIAIGYELHVRYHYFFSPRPVDTRSFWLP
jgi:hypothetical protein